MEYRSNNVKYILSTQDVCKNVWFDMAGDYYIEITKIKMETFKLTAKFDDIQIFKLCNTLIRTFSVNLKKYLPALEYIVLEDNNKLYKINIIASKHFSVLRLNNNKSLKKVKIYKGSCWISKGIKNKKTYSKIDFYINKK